MKTYLTLALFAFLSLTTVSCNCTKSSFDTKKATSEKIMTTINNTSWVLKRLDVQNRDFIPTEEQKELVLSFQDTNYGSSDGCNGNGGEFAVEDNKISFTKGMSTMRYCGDEMKHLVYSVSFGSVKSMEIKKDQLQLFDADNKVVATYIRKK